MSDQGRLVLGRYRLVERVGHGGMGTVWRAEDELLGRHVAVKKLHVPPHLHDDELERLYERTRREARSAARIAHPNVTVVHDVVDDEGLPCIVMEYVPSVTLGDVLKQRGSLPVEEVARIGSAMAAALRAAHGAGVLHRDIKPANVLLGHDGRIVLTDFGIAVEPGAPSLTKTGELVGSIHYLAPERLRGGIADPGPASDLWSLGATLYQAVEGRHPFQRDTAIETAYAIAAHPHDPPRRAGELTSVIEGLLVKEPGQRMDAAEAAHLLHRATGQQTSGGQTSRTQQLPFSSEAPTRVGPEAGTPWPAQGRPGPATGNQRAAQDHPTPPTGGQWPGQEHPTPPTGARPPTGATTAPATATGGRGRRAALWSLAAVALAGAVTAGVTLWPDTGTTSANAGPQHSGTASDAARPSPSPSPGGHGEASGNGGASKDAEASSPPKPTPPPPVPSGYTLQRSEKGFSVPVQDGWSPQQRAGGGLTFVDPTNLAGLRVDVTKFAGSDPLQHWRDTQEEQTRRDTPGYERVRMDSTRFRGKPAGYWEFTFQGKERGFRAAEVGFSTDDGTQYVIYLSAPSEQWDHFKPAFDAAVEGIRLPE